MPNLTPFKSTEFHGDCPKCGMVHDTEMWNVEFYRQRTVEMLILTCKCCGYERPDSMAVKDGPQ
jgi:C4-type Zn-finger protein